MICKRQGHTLVLHILMSTLTTNIICIEMSMYIRYGTEVKAISGKKESGRILTKQSGKSAPTVNTINLILLVATCRRRCISSNSFGLAGERRVS